ncbi:PorV/PorQ family protein [Ignavibacterium album]|uniref:PorV/PorQ family protein n=1 Tax=Ignavibacterium album TaxID=591197 RepID=UPI0035B92E87
MFLKKILLVVTIACLAVTEIFAGGQNRAGTAGAPELRIPIGARYLSLVGAPIATANGLEAIYWNPAGVDITPNSANALFSYRSYIADMSMNFAAVSGRLGEIGSVAISFRSLNIGDIQVTTMDQPDGTGQIISPNYFVLSLNYSKQLTDRVAVGVGFNLINETIDRVSASGLSFDIGVQYRNLLDVNGLALGVVVKNLGPQIKFDGNGLFVNANDPNSQRGPTFLKVDAQAADLPSEIALGVSYLRQIDDENSLQISGAFQNNNYSYDDYKVGLEYSYKNLLFIRGGYLFSPQSTDITPNIFQNYSLGAGLNLREFSGLDLSVDYAYVPVKYFDANHVFALSFGF